MNSMWSMRRSSFAGGEKLECLRNRCAASFSAIIAGWQDDADCRAIFLDALAQTPFEAFFWEMPPISRGHTDIPYECVVIACRALAGVAPDRHAFATNFGTSDETVAIFPNLGGDALLVAPLPIGDAAAWGHLAAFLRHGPNRQKHDFLRALGRAAERELDSRAGRIWISTSGLGVAWLHARLDSRPKYYQHLPYRER